MNHPPSLSRLVLTISANVLAVVFLMGVGASCTGTQEDTEQDQVLDEALSEIEAYAVRGMEEWGIPGMAIAVVKDGEVAYAKGFGFRDPDLTHPVTAETAFSLASMTKAFTATTLGLLVEEGLIGWDDPVAARVPEFRLADDILTAQVSLRDLLSHRTGLTEKSSLWTDGEYRAEDIFSRLHELEPGGEFRNHYEYSNVLFIGAAVLVQHLSDEDWTSLARRRIVDPLGMTGTGFSVEELLAEDDLSFSFSRGEEGFSANEFPAPEHNAWYFPRASGSMYSTARDMGHWMMAQLEDGHFGGDPVIPAAILQETHTPANAFDDPPFYLAYPGIEDHAYGMGWFIDTYHGHRRVHHGGASMGYSNHLTLFPDDGIGIVILGNREVLFPVELMYVAGDLLLGLEPEDWKGRFEDYRPG